MVILGDFKRNVGMSEDLRKLSKVFRFLSEVFAKLSKDSTRLSEPIFQLSKHTTKVVRTRS
jgi:hypothetical protein